VFCPTHSQPHDPVARRHLRVSAGQAIEGFIGSGDKLESSEVLQEIREVNLAYLLLAQRLVRENQLEAMFRLGVSKEIADILAKLTPAQLVKLAASNMVLCRFRFDDHALLSTLTHTAKSHDMQQIHAAILLARQPVESLN
jgi:flagellar transcriptional activator FlhD